MPIPMVLTSSDNRVGGAKFSRFGGPVYSGTVADGGTGGPLPAPGGIMLIQSTASLTGQVVSTAAANRGSYVYIAITTGSLIGASAPPYVSGVGTPVVWNDATKTLAAWSSGSSSWLVAAVLTTGAAPTAQPVVFTSS